MSKLLCVGTVAFDQIETPFGKTGKILGGAATYIALSAINKYEILFWTDSSEKCKKMAKSAKSTSTDYLPNLERKNRKSDFFETNITTIAKCFEFWNKTPEPGLFPYLSFHDRLRTFENLDFFILKSLFFTSKCLNYLKTPSFRPDEFLTRSSFGK